MYFVCFSGNLFFYINAAVKEKKVLFSFMHCWNSLCIEQAVGLETSNIDLFPSLSSTRAIAFCRAGLFKETSLLSFCPFHSFPNCTCSLGS